MTAKRWWSLLLIAKPEEKVPLHSLRESFPASGATGGVRVILHRVLRAKSEHANYQRMLKHIPSNAERTLWWRLRLERTGAKFRREHPIGQYRADFACLELALVIELDGGQHMTADAQAYDARRDLFMRQHGWTVLRVWTLWWFENPDGVMRSIDDAISLGRLERRERFSDACVRTPLNKLRVLNRALIAV